MSKTLLSKVGRFQWWSYSVSHAQLLLRSTASVSRQTQIDVLFKDVLAVQLPTSIDDLEILEGDDESRLAAGRPLAGRRLFVIRGQGMEGYIIAGTVLHSEGAGAHGDPSPLIPVFPPVDR
jgi:hypothetical protein